MSGHSRWSQIKHQKGAADVKKGALFGKLSKLISIAAKKGAEAASNIQLQNAIDQARTANMPKDVIERAIKRATDKGALELREVTVQAMGPGGSMIVITAITDNSNRTMGDIKNILSKNGAKVAGEGSLDYQFDKKMVSGQTEWTAKYPITLDDTSKAALDKILEELGENDDVQDVFSNIQE